MAGSVGFTNTGIDPMSAAYPILVRYCNGVTSPAYILNNMKEDAFSRILQTLSDVGANYSRNGNCITVNGVTYCLDTSNTLFGIGFNLYGDDEQLNYYNAHKNSRGVCFVASDANYTKVAVGTPNGFVVFTKM